MTRLPPGLYGIVDAELTARAGLDLERFATGLATAGCRVIQLRAKAWTDDEVLSCTRALVPPLHRLGCLLIVNDHPEAAARGGAAGVHLGQDDRPVSEARAIVGPDRLVGLSTHDLGQVRAAQGSSARVDYIGFGPVFPTRTKDTGWAERGLTRLSRCIRATELPVVAIGGITARRLPLVRRAGARRWAMISALLVTDDLAEIIAPED